MRASKRVIKYIKGTWKYGVKFLKHREFKIIDFSNNDWGSSIDDMKSTPRYCFSLGPRMFSWSLKKKEIMSQSFVEVEFVSASYCESSSLVKEDSS